MSILIGGSPSTGSSLLRRILNRHPKVFCGSESSLFCKPELYSNWQSRRRLLRPSLFGLKNAGWHHFIGLSLEEDYLHDRNDLTSLLNSSEIDFPKFINAFYEPILKRYRKSIWAEKTPANVFCFEQFIKTFKEAKFIHITRHPQDCIASLVNRGMPVYQAVAVYMLNTSEGLKHLDSKNVHTLSYEALVLNPEDTLKALFSFLEIAFDPAILKADIQAKGTDYMKGWKYKESGEIEAGSVERFKSLPPKTQILINSYIYYMSSNLSKEFSNINLIAKKLNYKLADIEPDQSILPQLKKERKIDMFKRTLKRAYFTINNYPIDVKF